MNNFYQKLSKTPHLYTLLVIAFVILIFGTLSFLHLQNDKNQKSLIDKEIEKLNLTLNETNENLNNLRNENATLTLELEEKNKELKNYEKQVKKINNKVETLQKYKETDKQLLEKYSKVYFLNEHYKPISLSSIKSEYSFTHGKTLEIHTEVLPHLEDMIEEAKEDGITLSIISAYRSYDTQIALKSGYKVLYGSGANQFSADQGYSEHQLGTTVDLTTPSVGGTYLSFANTDTYKWLVDHSYLFGFVLSYPPNNKYYQYEPWHWRFVGTDLARKLHRDNIYFYDMDQRTINEYLVEIFD